MRSQLMVLGFCLLLNTSYTENDSKVGLGLRQSPGPTFESFSVYAQEIATVQTTEFSFILKPSPIGGIGVFATHAIPAGSQVLSGKFLPRKMKTQDIPEEFLKYCVHLNDEECLCPRQFDRMEIGWYLNHSDNPNIMRKSEYTVFAIRDIKAGEEIFMDYNQLDEPTHLKEAYYWNPDKAL